MVVVLSVYSGCRGSEAGRDTRVEEKQGSMIYFERAEKAATPEKVVKLDLGNALTIRRLRVSDSGIVLLNSDGTLTSYHFRTSRPIFTVQPGAETGGRFTDFRIASDGRIVALDGTQALLLSIAENGEVQARVSVRSMGQFTRFSIDESDELHAVTLDSIQPLIHFKLDGSLVSRRAFPTGDYSRLPALARQGYVVKSRQGVLIIALSEASKVLMHFPNDQFTTIDFPENVPFPFVLKQRKEGGVQTRLSRTRPATRAIALNIGSIAVVPSDSTAHSGVASMDTFDASSGAYLGSWRFPSRIVDIDAFKGRYYVLLKSGEIWML